MFINALEHGSDHCEIGYVLVEVRMGVGAALCVITQPKPLPDMSSIKIPSLRDKMMGHRGYGMFNVAYPFYPMVGFENLPEGGARTIILETRQRLVAMDKVIREKGIGALIDAPTK